MRKRLIPAFLILLLALIASVPAMADDAQAEWEASCNWVIFQDATLYTAALKEEASPTAPYDFTGSGVLPAGTKVSIRSSVQGMREICYWDGGECIGWVESSAVRWAVSSPSPGSQVLQPTDTWKTLDVTLHRAEGEDIPVTLQVLGSAQCIVYDGAEMLTVDTENLRWETEAEPTQRLGVIYAPKTGKATLRASASSSAKSLGQCEDGRVVVVLKVGSTWTRILYDGTEGCVLTAALTLCGSVPEGGFSHAILAYKGRTDTSAAISLHNAGDASRTINQWRAGTQVVVLKDDGSWAEIEVDGWHGIVKSDHLK